jgi:hypothetical protein
VAPDRSTLSPFKGAAMIGSVLAAMFPCESRASTEKACEPPPRTVTTSLREAVGGVPALDPSIKTSYDVAPAKEGQVTVTVTVTMPPSGPGAVGGVRAPASVSVAPQKKDTPLISLISSIPSPLASRPDSIFVPPSTQWMPAGSGT